MGPSTCQVVVMALFLLGLMLSPALLGWRVSVLKERLRALLRAEYAAMVYDGHPADVVSCKRGSLSDTFFVGGNASLAMQYIEMWAATRDASRTRCACISTLEVHIHANTCHVPVDLGSGGRHGQPMPLWLPSLGGAIAGAEVPATINLTRRHSCDSTEAWSPSVGFAFASAARLPDICQGGPADAARNLLSLTSPEARAAELRRKMREAVVGIALSLGVLTFMCAASCLHACRNFAKGTRIQVMV